MKRVSMRKTNLFLFFLLFLNQVSLADRITNALKQIQKGEFDKAKELLQKELEKDSLSAGAYHVFAIYFFSEKNQAFHLDSAYFSVNKALQCYKNANPKDLAGWIKEKISAESAKELQKEIEGEAFKKSKKENTIAAYEIFLSYYSEAAEVTEAKERRNELAWKEAEAGDSPEAYENFILHYPDALQISQAIKKRDKLRYELETKNGRLSEYLQFLEKYPSNSHKEEAIQRVYSLSTLPHTAAVYEEFIQNYPHSASQKRAWDWLLTFFQKEGSLQAFIEKYPNYYDAVALSNLARVSSLLYAPVYEKELFGFIDETGEMQIPFSQEEIFAAYHCEALKNPYLFILENNRFGLMDKLGKKLMEPQFDQLSIFVPGIYKAVKNIKTGLFHQNGTELLEVAYDAIEALNQKFLKAKKNRRWALFSYNGLQLTDFKFSDIEARGNAFIVFKTGDGYAVEGNEGLIKLFQEKNKEMNPEFEGVELLAEGYAQVRKGNAFGVIDSLTRAVVPCNFQEIRKLSASVWSAKAAEGWQLFNSFGDKLFEQHFENVASSDQFIACKINKKWGLLNVQGELVKEFQYDSLNFIGEILILFKAKKVAAEFTGQPDLPPVDLTPYKLISAEKAEAKDAPFFLNIENTQRKKGLFNQKGVKILPAVYDDVYILDEQHILIKQAGKYGLTDIQGKLLLAPKYDGINIAEKGSKTILKGGKFGLFDPAKKILIEPLYESALQLLKTASGRISYVAEKKEGKGIINAANKTLLPFKFTEIEFWKDSTVLAKDKKENWGFYIMNSPKSQAVNDFLFQDVKVINQENGENLAIVKKNNLYGLWHNQSGMEIPRSYELIKNIGTKTQPLFFAEKYNREEKNYDVAYINSSGKIIWNKTFSEDEYNKMICEK